MTDNFHLGDNRIELAELVADAFDNAQLDTIFKNRFRVPANRVCSGFNGSSLEFANGIIDYLENQGLFYFFFDELFTTISTDTFKSKGDQRRDQVVLFKFLKSICPSNFRSLLLSPQFHMSKFSSIISSWNKDSEFNQDISEFLSQYNGFEKKVRQFSFLKEYHDEFHRFDSALIGVFQKLTSLRNGDIDDIKETRIGTADRVLTLVTVCESICDNLQNSGLPIESSLSSFPISMKKSLEEYNSFDDPSNVDLFCKYALRYQGTVSQAMSLSNNSMVEVGKKIISSDFFDKFQTLLNSSRQRIRYDWLIISFKNSLEFGVEQHDVCQTVRTSTLALIRSSRNVLKKIETKDQDEEYFLNGEFQDDLVRFQASWDVICNRLESILLKTEVDALGTVFSELDKQSAFQKIIDEINELEPSTDMQRLNEKLLTFGSASKQHFLKVDTDLKNECSNLMGLMLKFKVQIQENVSQAQMSS